MYNCVTTFVFYLICIWFLFVEVVKLFVYPFPCFKKVCSKMFLHLFPNIQKRKLLGHKMFVQVGKKYVVEENIKK